MTITAKQYTNQGNATGFEYSLSTYISEETNEVVNDFRFYALDGSFFTQKIYVRVPSKIMNLFN